MVSSYKVTANYNSSRNGGRRVCIHIINARIWYLRLLAKSTNCFVLKSGGTLRSGYWNIFQSMKEWDSNLQVKVIVQGQNCFLSDTPMVIVGVCVKFHSDRTGGFGETVKTKSGRIVG